MTPTGQGLYEYAWTLIFDSCVLRSMFERRTNSPSLLLFPLAQQLVVVVPRADL
jgi:hypothetical protein